MKGAFRVGLVGLCLCWLPGCIVIPIAELLKRQPLKEHVLVDGAGFLLKKKIAVIEINGVISSDSSYGLLSSSENTVVEVQSRLKKIRLDPEVHAVVLQIASPGGEVTACDIIYHTLVRFKKETGVPIVASIVEQGASGAYYIAMASDEVIAHPTAIVGSIGVILQSYNVSGLLAKIGVAVAPIKSAELKDINSPFRDMSDAERQVLQTLVDDLYGRFLDIVDKGRSGLNKERVKELADGRVVSGVAAVDLGLVDRTGYLADAIEHARRMANISNPTIVHYTRPGGRNTRLSAVLDDRVDTSSDFRLQVETPRFHGAKLYYLWQPGL